MGKPQLLTPSWVAATLAILLVPLATPAETFSRNKFLWTEFSIQFSNLGRASASATSSGLGKIHTSASYSSHLSSIDLIEASLVTAVPVTDPNAAPITTIVLDLHREGGRIGNISGAIATPYPFPALTPNTLPMTGFATLCLLSGVLPPCVPQINLPMGGTSMGQPAGHGVGGLLTLGGAGTVRISLVGGPYSVATVSAVARTPEGGIDILTARGFAHGPLSLTSSTALTSAVLQLVTATHTTTVGPGDQDLGGMISRTLVHVMSPEPSLPSLLVAGAVALAWLGQRRRGRR
ncbi:MAG: hypothetical protein ACQGVC_07440 [Myxococcota bacterium]